MVDIVQTPTGILSYPHLFKPRAVNDQSEPRYSCNIIFDAEAQQKPEYQQLRKIANQAAADFFGDKMKDPRFKIRVRSPFHPCALKAGVSGYDVPDGVYISAWSRDAIKVVGPGGSNDEITVPGDVFPGQRARIQVNAFAYENAGNVGVSFGLRAVQITKRNMPRLDGRAALPFDRSTEEDADDDDAFGGKQPAHAGGGNDDDIPFFTSLQVA